MKFIRGLSYNIIRDKFMGSGKINKVFCLIKLWRECSTMLKKLKKKLANRWKELLRKKMIA